MLISGSFRKEFKKFMACDCICVCESDAPASKLYKLNCVSMSFVASVDTRADVDIFAAADGERLSIFILFGAGPGSGSSLGLSATPEVESPRIVA